MSVNKNGPVMHQELGPCMEWTGARDKDGYGWFSGFGQRKAHRASYVLHKGPIPKGKQVLHRCDYPPCIHPEHIHAGSNAENHREKAARGRAKGINVGARNGNYKHGRRSTVVPVG